VIKLIAPYEFAIGLVIIACIQLQAAKLTLLLCNYRKYFERKGNNVQISAEK
jgi:hypothetical protein